MVLNGLCIVEDSWAPQWCRRLGKAQGTMSCWVQSLHQVSARNFPLPAILYLSLSYRFRENHRTQVRLTQNSLPREADAAAQIHGTGWWGEGIVPFAPCSHNKVCSDQHSMHAKLDSAVAALRASRSVCQRFLSRYQLCHTAAVTTNIFLFLFK